MMTAQTNIAFALEEYDPNAYLLSRGEDQFFINVYVRPGPKWVATIDYNVGEGLTGEQWSWLVELPSIEYPDVHSALWSAIGRIIATFPDTEPAADSGAEERLRATPPVDALVHDLNSIRDSAEDRSTGVAVTDALLRHADAVEHRKALGDLGDDIAELTQAVQTIAGLLLMEASGGSLDALARDAEKCCVALFPQLRPDCPT